MPAVNTEDTFNASIENVFEVIKNFSDYPDFVDGVEEIEILSETKNSIKAKYTLNLIKRFQYTINVKLDEPNGLSWTFDSGDLFKKNDGFWKLEKLDDNTTKATYGLDVELKMFAPKMMVNKLVKTNLPIMMKAFKKRSENL